MTQIPFISKKKMAELDRITVKDYNISTRQMMELAGYHTARLASQVTDNKKILLLAGSGNNGGDAIASARFLHNIGYNPHVFLAKRNFKKESRHHLKIIEEIGVGVSHNKNLLEESVSKAGLIIDGLVGFNLEGAPRGEVKQFIHAINNSSTNKLAVDVPTGVDADSGEMFDPHVDADYTLALSLPKKGLKENKAVGNLYLADVGVPPEAYRDVGVEKNCYFKEEPIIRIR